MGKWIQVLIFVVLGLAVLLGFTGCGTIETGNVGVRTTLGKVNAEEIEPGIYLPGRFGIRLEDIVILRKDGPEILSALPRQVYMGAV